MVFVFEQPIDSQKEAPMSSLHDKRVILLNPMAGSAERILELEAMLEGRPGCCILQTEREGHAMELARQAREQGARQIIAADSSSNSKIR